MYRVMQVGSSGEMIELPQIVTGSFTSGTAQPALINPLNCKRRISTLHRSQRKHIFHY